MTPPHPARLRGTETMNFCTARLIPEKALFRPALPLHSLPGLNGTTMTKMTYREQLKHPNWQRRRLEILARDGFACCGCHDTESTLHVHHKHSSKAGWPGSILTKNLSRFARAAMRRGMRVGEGDFKLLLARLRVDGPCSTSEARKLLAGWANNRCGHDMSGEMQGGPFLYMIGEIAASLDDLGLKELSEVRDALICATPPQIERAMLEMARSLVREMHA